MPRSVPNTEIPNSRLDRLTLGLNSAQRQAVTVDATPLRVIAGAGSGKTRVLTHRIAYRAESNVLDPERVLAVTFTRKAASELRDRLSRVGLRQGVVSGTFHSIAFTQLRQRWEERGVRSPELLDRKVGFVSGLMTGKDRSSALDVVGEIEWASARMITPEQYEREAQRANRRPPLTAGAVAGIYERFIKEKLRRRVVDFDDLLRLAIRDIEADPVYASALHWRFRHLFVDEFQDVNPLQYHLLKAWLGPESDLCAVGDPNQAIYAWNGADARYINDFDTHFPGSTTVVLDQNYRSTPQILAVANAVLREGVSTPLRLQAQRPDGAVPQVRVHEDATSEARAIARSARDRHAPGVAWSHQAVLVRTNAQATLIAEELARAGIPHRVRGSGDLLTQPEVRDALRMVRKSPTLEMALSDIAETVNRIAPMLIEDQTAAGQASMGTSPDDERAANLNEVIRLGREYLDVDPTGGTAGFMGWLNSALQGDNLSNGDAVEVMSFHAAKGLEWPVVHLSGLEDGFVPIHHSRDHPPSVEEERRLLYVAMTRARDELICNWAQTRTFGTRSAKRRPSPWLSAVSSTTVTAAPVLTGRAGARRAREARAALKMQPSSKAGHSRDQLTDEQADLFQELRRWRKQQADAADVPAFVVFSDETLTQLVRSAPSSKADLLNVKGIGAVKAERYCEDLLRIIGGSPR